MSSILGTVSQLFAPILFGKSIKRVQIEEWTFRLHFRVTSILLFLFTAILCMREYIGEHIKCQSHHDDYSNDPVIPRKVIERYCFIQTTFTVPYDTKTTSVDRIRSDTKLGGPMYVAGSSERKHHAYYQWMPFYLFFLGLVFLLTHHIWKAVENGKVQSLVEELNTRDLMNLGESKRIQKISRVARYILQSKGSHGFWAFCYVACEFANLLLVIGSMYVTDIFLGREFTLYGPRVIQFLEDDPENRIDPMAVVFPRITKCLFYMYGPSGGLQRFDALCILPSNIVNEKIFTFLWFWFVFLMLVTVGSLLHRTASLVLPKLRVYGLVGSGLSSHFPLNAQSVMVLRKLGISDWFLLRFLKLNLDHDTFRLLVKTMYEEIL